MTKQDIIQAAFRAWGRSYYKLTSLSDVARELGVSKPALYRHFCSKQALLDAMYDSFLNDYTVRLKDDYKLAMEVTDRREALFIVVRAIIGYFARNVNGFIFALIYVYGAERRGNTGELLLGRGVDMGIFDRFLKGTPPQAVMSTFAFSMAYFHRLGRPGGTAAGDEEPSKQEIDREISLVYCIISHGIGFQKEEIEVLDYEALERQVLQTSVRIEENELLHAVAKAVAGAGIGDVSMKMVARVSGLSKSGLYAHFKNKQDMLVQLFVTEFDRIIDFAENSMKGSAVTAERLYLMIFAICDYLRSRPDILIALDWLRTRRLTPLATTDLSADKPEDKRVPFRLYRIFRDIQPSPELREYLQDTREDWIPAWILFMLVNSTVQGGWGGGAFSEWPMAPKGPKGRLFRRDFSRIPNESFRILYRFIVRGIQEFTPQG
ncbi:MAG: TetR/AcrR family transcriptional regulator [Treponema sp.]|jgi:AcrR family transcriptional regulator|nr:TetR/AcrR family transcriptional regulator [Treponema sp.]